ncbi:MAG: DUF4091 domain-containing protein [Arachnia sp.]
MMTTPARTSWTTTLCDSLEKVFADAAPRPIDSAIPLAAYRGQRVSFQIAVLPPTVEDPAAVPAVVVDVTSSSPVETVVHAVELVPNDLPAPEDADDGYLRTAPGLFPDLLRPVDGAPVPMVMGQWRSAWVDVTIPDDTDGGDVVVDVSLRLDTTGEVIATHCVTVLVVADTLPALSITNTHWFHCDGLAQYYGHDVFSEPHWQSIDNFMGSAAAMRVNSVLTPVWTPPLDTARGGLRLPTQLVGIRDTGGERYSFDFAQLGRWLQLCRKHRMRGIEVAHLFTQWGAEATPAIYVDTEAGQERRFGWDVPATDPRYRTLLEQLIPQLRSFMDERWGLDHVIFHVSDEPLAANLATYSAAKAVVQDLLEGCTVVDAIGDFELYEQGVVDIPVVATDHAQPFLDANVEPLWLYYCVGQVRDVANRFMSLPSSRNRVLGTQLWLAGAHGFLHWGFNFYNTVRSVRPTDPFRDTTAGGGFFGGDAFVVYPGPRGQPLESIRHRVFTEAMDDHRAMQLLASRAGDEAVRAIADPDGSITLKSYPSDPNHYRRVALRMAEAIVASAPGLLKD